MTISTIAPALATMSGNLRPRAVVDWLAFTVQLKKASNGGILKRKYENYGVSEFAPLDAGPGSAANAFKIDLQAPEKYGVVKGLLADLEASYGLSEPPKLDALEVSVDFWPKGGDFNEGATLTKRLMMSLAPPVMNNPRLVDSTPPTYMPKGVDIDINRTLYIGNDNEDLMWRVYWKRTDRTFLDEEGVRHPKDLPESEWRARAEVRLQGNALASLSLTTPMDLEAFRFEEVYSLNYFRFCERVVGNCVVASNPYAQHAARQLGVDLNSPACVLGKFGRKDSRMRTKKLSRNLLTDSELSEAARSALRGLSRRF